MQGSGTTPDTNNTPLHLAQRVQHLRSAFEALAEHGYVPRQLLVLLESFEALRHALELHEQLRIWSGKEPPYLGAVVQCLRQSDESLRKQRFILSQAASVQSRRDSGRAGYGDWPALDHEVTRLRGPVEHCTLLVKNFNFVTVLKTAFVDTSRGFEWERPGISHRAIDAGPQHETLADIVFDLARLWHRLRLTSGQSHSENHEASSQLLELEIQKETLLDRLTSLVGLESRPLPMGTLMDLSELASTEYERSVISVGALAVRHGNDLSSEHRAPLRECRVRILLDGHPEILAASFQMAGNHCRWLDENGHLILLHIFSKSARERYPWKHASQHDSLTVAFTRWQSQKSEIRCQQNNHPSHFDKTPEYRFQSSDGYKLFQSCMREKVFIEEFELTSIKSKGGVSTQTSELQFIKFWQSQSENAERTVTIPVTFADNQVRTQEIPLRWTRFEKIGSMGAKLELNQAPRRASGASSSPQTSRPQSGRKSSILRTLTDSFKTSPSAAEINLLPPHRIAPQEWTQKFQYFLFVFADSHARDRCAELFQAQDIFASPHPIRSPPSLSLPSPAATFDSLSPAPTVQLQSTAPTSITSNENVSSSPLSTMPPSADDLRLPEPLLHDHLKKGGPKLPARISYANNNLQARQESPYMPLPSGGGHIRLLRIDGGSGPGLSCALEHHHLDRAPRYESVSYCWGREPNTRTIPAGSLQGFAISEHLWRALCRMRLRNKPRLLWIDAICINQADVYEKNSQIAMMRDIYATALRTVIWIGDSNPDKPTCPRIVSDEDDEEQTLCSLDGLSALEHDDVNQDLRKDLIRLQERDESSGLADVWWKRVWCVQEFNFSRRPPSVFVGPHAIRWTHLWNLFDQKNNPLELFYTLRSPTLHPLFQLLSMMGSFSCSDPRDRIYALLGMLQTNVQQSPIVADYRKSVVRVMEEAAMFLIRESQTLDVLLDHRVSRQSWGPDQLKGVMPTWLPDVTCLQKSDLVKGKDIYNAGPGQPAVLLIEGSSTSDLSLEEYDIPCTLQVRAVYFDRISKRTITNDIPDYEHSPDYGLIYNSLGRRGYTIDNILAALDYDFAMHQSLSRHKQLDPSPCLGRLMLDYLFEGRRSIVAELGRRAEEPERDVVTSYERQEREDLSYTEHERSAKDTAYVRARWEEKIRRNMEGEMFTGSRMQPALDTGNRNIEQDYLVARDLENIFAYARRSGKRYYLTGNNFDAPMRRDVLQCKSLAEVKRLRTQYDLQGKDLEFHEYSAKSRERDFFKTSAGFLGLGPSCLREGDEIIVPIGSSRPWIIRKSEGLGPYYNFVGEAVIPSTMSGRWSTLEQDSATDYRIK